MFDIQKNHFPVDIFNYLIYFNTIIIYLQYIGFKVPYNRSLKSANIRAKIFALNDI